MNQDHIIGFLSLLATLIATPIVLLLLLWIWMRLVDASVRAFGVHSYILRFVFDTEGRKKAIAREREQDDDGN